MNDQQTEYREFSELVHDRIRTEPEFAMDLFREAMQSFFDGDPEAGKIMLREYIKGAIGWKALADMMNKKDKSLMRMLSASGNPQSANFFELVQALQTANGVGVEVRVVDKSVRGA